MRERLLRDPRFAELVLGTLPRDCVVILAFHRVGIELPPWHFGTTPVKLERVVTSFARVAAPISLRELGTGPVRGRRLAITFDDGFADNAEVAASLLERLGLPAAFFLPAGCIEAGVAPWPDRAYAGLLCLDPGRLARLAARLAPGRDASTPLAAAHAVVHGLKLVDPDSRERLVRALPDGDGAEGRPMTWDQARGLVAAGFDVGSHGHTHAVLTTLEDDRLAFELQESKRLIESRLSAGCDLLAYPDDRFDARVASAASAAGYRLALGGDDRANVPPLVPLELARIGGEDARIGALALRLRRPRRAQESFGEAVAHYEDGRSREYGFLTQARWVRRVLAERRPSAGAVLDAGCGAGALAPFLVEGGAGEIVGVDAEPGMVDAARRRFPAHRWLRADVTRLPFPDDRFASAVSLGVLEYVPEPSAALRELVRVVEPGGSVLVSVPQRGAPNDLAFRLAGAFGVGARERSRPLTRSELLDAAGRARLRVRRIAATNFFAFPLDTLFPGPSRRLAEALDRSGGIPGLRRLGAQLLLEAAVEPRAPVAWLVPALPTRTTFLDRELAELRRLGVPVEPVTPRLGFGALRTFLRRPVASAAAVLRLQLLKAPLDKERGRLGYVMLALKGMELADSLERSRATVHASFADGVGTVAYCAASLARVPFTFTAHAPFSLWQGSALLRRQAEAAQRVFCVSEDVERRLGRLAPASTRTVARCLGPSEAPAKRPAAAPFLLVAVGAGLPHKGFATAVEAVADAVAGGADVRLELLGDGPELRRLRRSRVALALGDRITFGGEVPNAVVLDRLAAALALVAPCEVQPDGDRDGLPVSILDAAACGTPAIATAVSGITEFVVDGEAGLIVPERDPHALAEAILRLSTDPELAERLGRAARDRLDLLHDPAREVGKLAESWFGDGAGGAGAGTEKFRR